VLRTEIAVTFADAVCRLARAQQAVVVPEEGGTEAGQDGVGGRGQGTTDERGRQNAEAGKRFGSPSTR